MTRAFLVIVFAGVLCLIAPGQEQAASSPPRQAAAAPADVNFAEHIAPIVFDKCATCHRSGEAAPFALLSYKDVRKRGKLIQEVTESRYMPPWQPAPGHGDFLNERCLGDGQIAMIKRWVETGMAEGDPAKLPAAPTFADGWALGKPDLVVSMDQTFTVPATGRDIYKYFTLPVNLPEDKWITAIDLKPSARSVVHHVLLFSGTGTKGAGKVGGGKAGGAGNIAGLFAGGGNSLGGWVPGTLAQHLPGDLAMSFPKGSNLTLQTHFHPSGKEEQEKTTIALYFAKKKPTRTLVNFQAPPLFGATAGINIPAGAKNYTIKGKFKIPVDMELISISGHAHYVCESIEATAKLPDGTTKPLLYLPHWDFNWQSTYMYRQPVRLPKGAVIEALLTYNNSAANPVNPFNPPQAIKWGTATTDEMGSVIINALPVQESDLSALRQSIQSQTIDIDDLLKRFKKKG